MVLQETTTYDAIVIGSGISGGWAAKELTEKGLKTLVLERGRELPHVSGYTTATKDPWEFKYRGQVALREIDNYSTDKGRGAPLWQRGSQRLLYE